MNPLESRGLQLYFWFSLSALISVVSYCSRQLKKIQINHLPGTKHTTQQYLTYICGRYMLMLQHIWWASLCSPQVAKKLMQISC